MRTRILAQERFPLIPPEQRTPEQAALAAGLPAAIADQLAQGRCPEGMTEDQRIVYQFRTELHRTRFVSDATYEAAKQRSGEQGVVDLIAVSGYDVAVAMTLNTARVGLPNGVAPPLNR